MRFHFFSSSIVRPTVLPRMFFFLFLFATFASAQEVDRILIPSVAREPIAGAFNSLWVTEISGRNVGSTEVRFFWSPCPLFECDYYWVPPGSSFGAEPFDQSVHGAVAAFFNNDARRIILSARVRDLSREFDTWGTEIPVVRQSEVGTSEITLLNLPTSDRFRTMIRMYDFQNSANDFIVKVFPLDGATAIAEFVVPAQLLRGQKGANQGILFAVLGDLVPTSGAPERIRVTINTAKPGKFWAFASVTNNDTQHVTVISPVRAAAVP